MDNNAQNLTNAQNQPQTATGPAPRPPMPGPAQMGAAPRPVTPPTPVSAMPNLGGPRTASTAPTVGAATPAPVTPTAPGAAPTSGAVPGTPSPQAGTPAPNPAPAPAKKGLPKKTQYLILGGVVAVLIIACIIAAIFIINSNNKPAPVAQTTTVQPQTTEPAPLDELDKDGLIEAFDNIQAEDYNPGDALTEPLASAVHGHSVILIDSYADVEELEELTDLYNDEYDLDVQESDDGTYATIMAVDEDGVAIEGETLYVAFNEEYAEYDSANGISTTYTNPETSNPLLLDSSEDFVKEALPIIFLAQGNAISTIYDIDFETDADAVIMTVSSITYTYDTTATSTTSSSSTRTNVTRDDNSTDEDASEDEEETDSPYIIQALSSEMTADLETGVVSWDADDETIEISSFPVTEDEFIDGYTKMLEGIGLGDQADMLLSGGSLTIDESGVTIEGPTDEE